MENYENNPNGGGKMLWIIGGIVLIIAVVGIVYSATQKSVKNNTDTLDTIPLNQMDGQNGDVADATQMPAGHVPVTVTYTGFDIVNLQTFPYRVQVRVRGTVPEGCAVTQKPVATISGKTFTVSMTASKPADAICTQEIKNVEEVVELPVSGLAAGTYSVKIGNLTAKSFTLSQDNNLNFQSDK